MSNESKRKFPAPFVAIAVIIVAWAVVSLWPSPDRDVAIVEEAPQATEILKPLQAPTQGRTFEWAEAPPIVDDPADGEWSATT